MGHEHCQERLLQRLDLRAERTAVGDGERAVNGDDPLSGLDEIGVDQRPCGPAE
jgi:hypothetical protein